MKIGDYVCVKNWGAQYSTYTDWFVEHNIKSEYMIRYAYGDSSNYEKYGNYPDKRIFKILDIHSGNEFDDGLELALITIVENQKFTDLKDLEYVGKIYLIRTEALEQVYIMTQEEIEKKLGHKVIIVNTKKEY